MKVKKGDLYMITPVGVTPGLTRQSLLYMIVTSAGGRLRFVMLAIPDKWFGTEWREVRENHPIGRSYGWRGCWAGSMSYTLTRRKDWVDTHLIAGYEHKHVGNLVRSIETLIARTP